MAKETIKERFELKEIATETTQVIVDNETNKSYDVSSAIVKLLNDVEEIKKSVISQ